MIWRCNSGGHTNAIRPEPTCRMGPRPPDQNDLKFEYSIAGPDGVIIASSYRPAIGLSIAERKHFQVHANGGDDQLYVSAPLVAKNVGRMAVFLTRRLTAADGSFNGVLSVWVDLIQFEIFFRRLQLGPGGLLLLLHRDGYILAGGANGVARPDLTGKYFPQAHVLALSSKSDRVLIGTVEVRWIRLRGWFLSGRWRDFR